LGDSWAWSYCRLESHNPCSGPIGSSKWGITNSFNFPLNTITTIAELYIGFLVGASSNRSERNLEATLAKISAQDQQIDDVELKLSRALAENTALTKAIHELTTVIHETVCLSKGGGDK